MEKMVRREMLVEGGLKKRRRFFGGREVVERDGVVLLTIAEKSAAIYKGLIANIDQIGSYVKHTSTPL